MGRLYGDLVAHFGRGAVFMDVAAIKAGRDFRRVIDEQVSACGVLLFVIGRNWLEARDESGQRRLDLSADPVRLEVAAALRRDIPVVPVLVQGARIPPAEKLPADLADLAYRNAAELTHPRWTSDVQLLIKGLESDLGLSSDPTFKFTHNVPRSDDSARTAAVVPAAGVQRAAQERAPGSKQSAAADQSRAAIPRSYWPFVVGLLVTLAFAGGGAGYYWHQQALEAQRLEAEKAAAQKAEVDRVATVKAEADRIAAQKAQEAEDARADAERQAAETAAALEKAQQDAAAARAESAAARAEAQRLATDVRRQKAAAEAAVAKSRAAAQPQASRPTNAPSDQLTEWMTTADFINLRKSKPKGQDFPYNFQVGCMQSEPFRVRARFGSFPSGVRRFAYGVYSVERYQKMNSTHLSQGNKIFSRLSVSCQDPGGSGSKTWIAALWVQ